MAGPANWDGSPPGPTWGEQALALGHLNPRPRVSSNSDDGATWSGPRRPPPRPDPRPRVLARLFLLACLTVASFVLGRTEDVGPAFWWDGSACQTYDAQAVVTVTPEQCSGTAVNRPGEAAPIPLP